MKAKMKTLNKIAALRCRCGLGDAMVASALAQTPAATLAAERERTRARIAEVTADVVRDADTSMTLGRSLSPDLPKVTGPPGRGGDPRQGALQTQSARMAR